MKKCAWEIKKKWFRLFVTEPKAAQSFHSEFQRNSKNQGVRIENTRASSFVAKGGNTKKSCLFSSITRVILAQRPC